MVPLLDYLFFYKNSRFHLEWSMPLRTCRDAKRKVRQREGWTGKAGKRDCGER